jgi:hypothetical protein
MAMLMAATRRKSSTYLDTPRRQELDKSVEEFLPPLDFLRFWGGFNADKYLEGDRSKLN